MLLLVSGCIISFLPCGRFRLERSKNHNTASGKLLVQLLLLSKPEIKSVFFLPSQLSLFRSIFLLCFSSPPEGSPSLLACGRIIICLYDLKEAQPFHRHSPSSSSRWVVSMLGQEPQEGRDVLTWDRRDVLIWVGREWGQRGVENTPTITAMQ